MIIKDLNKTGRVLSLDETECLKVGVVILQSGEEVGEHITENKEEAIVVLSGQATVEIEGENSQTIDTCQLVYIPPNKKHNVKNTSDNPLHYLYLVSVIK